MKEMRSLLALLGLFLVLAPLSFLSAQTDTASVDRLFLKDGNLVQGKVDTVKSDTVIITEKASGTRFAYGKSRIKFILLSNAKYLSFPDEKQLKQITSKGEAHVFSPPQAASPIKMYLTFFGGIAAPVSEFASNSGPKAGYAKNGFAFGTDFSIGIARNLTLGFVASYSAYGVDVPAIENRVRTSFGTQDVTVKATSWGVFSAMVALGFNENISSATMVYWMVEYGLVSESSPDINGTANGMTFSQASLSSRAGGYGLGLGFFLHEKINVGIGYLTSKPRFLDPTDRGGNFEQLISALRFQVGYVFEVN